MHRSHGETIVSYVLLLDQYSQYFLGGVHVMTTEIKKSVTEYLNLPFTNFLEN